jgi:hypothetical protein
MYCRITLLTLLILLASAAGCRQCQNTHDYCGPLPEEPCDFMARKNSILYKGPQVQAVGDEVISEAEDGGYEEPLDGPIEPTPEMEGAPGLSPVPDPSYTSGLPTRRSMRQDE